MTSSELADELDEAQADNERLKNLLSSNEQAHIDLLSRWDSIPEHERAGYAKSYHLLLLGFGSLSESRDLLKHENRHLKAEIERLKGS